MKTGIRIHHWCRQCRNLRAEENARPVCAAGLGFGGPMDIGPCPDWKPFVPLRWCANCGRMLPMESFYRTSRGAFFGYCKTCHKAITTKNVRRRNANG